MRGAGRGDLLDLVPRARSVPSGEGQSGFDADDRATQFTTFLGAARSRSGWGDAVLIWCDTGDAMAEMREVDIRKMLELLQAIADAVEGIEKELSKLVGRGE
jgi:hypothetical protein